MFFNCILLTDLSELQTWNVSKCTNFLCMFANCESLQDINGLQTWNIYNGTNFSWMFASCKSLQDISLSDTLNCLTKEMFNKCNPNLKNHWKNNIYTYEDLLAYQTIY